MLVPEKRYLWTDAFAVCNLVGDGKISEARNLVNLVHQTLGRRRSDDAVGCGGAPINPEQTEEEFELNPTSGGLRIGKEFPEDPTGRDDWETDGQYFHYNTKWLHALVVMFAATDDEVFLHHAVEMIKGTHHKFKNPRDASCFCWKMSVDLTRPLKHSKGAHDAMDGLIVYSLIDLHLKVLGAKENIDEYVNDIMRMCNRELGRGGAEVWVTTDNLGIGGLLCCVHSLAAIFSFPRIDAGSSHWEDLEAVASGICEAAIFSLNLELHETKDEAVAFRDLGFSIGIRAVEIATSPIPECTISPLFEKVRKAAASRFEMKDQIIARWRKRKLDKDINGVMLETALQPHPTGFLSVCKKYAAVWPKVAEEK